MIATRSCVLIFFSASCGPLYVALTILRLCKAADRPNMIMLLSLVLSFLSIFFTLTLGSFTAHKTPLTATTNQWCTPSPVTGDEQAEIFSKFQHLAWSGKPERIEKAFHTYAVQDYIQHNPFLPQGAAPVVKLLKDLTKTTKLEAVRIAFDGE